MRLGIFPRAVIVASCFWMVGGTFFIAKNIDNEATARATRHYNECLKHFSEGVDCWKSRETIYVAHTDKIQGGLWGFAASTAAAYLVVALVALALVYSSVKWVLRGRQT